MPVDQNVGTCLVKLGSTCAPLQPPSSAKIHLKNLQKNRAAPLRPIALQRPSQWRQERHRTPSHFSNTTPLLLLKSLTQLLSHLAKLIIPGARGGQVLRHSRLFYARGFHSCLQRTHHLCHLRHGHGGGAFSSDGRNWTWTIASHFSHETQRITECSERHLLQLRSTQRSIGKTVQNSARKLKNTANLPTNLQLH